MFTIGVYLNHEKKMSIGNIYNQMKNNNISIFEKQIELLQKSLLEITFNKDKERLILFKSILKSLHKARSSHKEALKNRKFLSKS